MSNYELEFICPDCGEYRGNWIGLSAHIRSSECERSKEILKNQLKYAVIKFEEFIGEVPTKRDFKGRGPISDTPLKKYFGSFNRALKESGLQPNMEKDISEEELLTDLKGLGFYLGKSPSAQEIEKYCLHSRKVYARKFGSINEAKEEVGLKTVPKHPSGSDHYLFGVTGKDHHNYGETYGNSLTDSEKWKLDKWAREVKRRDNFICQECGGEEKLHAHHIKRKSNYPDKMFEIDNGITLCCECHADRHEGEEVYELLKAISEDDKNV